MSSSEFQDQRCRGSCYKVVVFVATGSISTARSIKMFLSPPQPNFGQKYPQKVRNRDKAEFVTIERKSSKDCYCEP